MPPRCIGTPGKEAYMHMAIIGHWNDPLARAVVTGVLEDPGWEPVDVGGVEQALHLEHMTLLWGHMVRIGGCSPRIVWAALKV